MIYSSLALATIQSEEPAWLTFKHSIRSPATLEVYSTILDLFKEHCHVTNFTNLLFGEDRKAIETKIIDWVVKLKDPTNKHSVKGNSLKVYLAVLKHFYDYNDVTTINWRKLQGYLPDTTVPKQDKPYSVEQIRKLLDHSDLRMKVIILLQASAGLRVGAVVKLRIRDLEKVGHIYKINVYTGTKEQYQTFCSPECASLIDEYLRTRKTLGEDISPEAPLIREMNSIPNAPRFISVTTVSNMMTGIARRAGLRTINKEDPYDRKETKLNHGLRKFCRQQMRRAKVDNIIIERLLGHQSGNIK